MKPALIFHQYIWIINKLKVCGPQTFEQLNRMWQRELTSTPDYTDFAFDIRPTADFLGQLLSHGEGIEVLQPLELRQKMRAMIEENLKRY